MHRSPEIQRQQTALAAHFRKKLARTFEPELSTLAANAAATTLELLDLHASWETWDRLRTWQRLPVERAQQLVSDLLAQALERR